MPEPGGSWSAAPSAVTDAEPPQPSHPGPLRPRISLRWLVAGNVILASLLMTLAGVSLVASRDSFTQRAQLSAENLAATLQQSLQTEISKIDMALQNVVQQSEHELAEHDQGAFAIQGILSRQLTLVPVMESLRITNENGVIRIGTGVAADNVPDLSDRAYFQRLRDTPGIGLVISEPLQSRVTDQWVVVFARRMQHPDGRFAGIAYAAIPVRRFQDLLSTVDLGPRGAVTLRTSDLSLVARHAPGQDSGPSIGSRNVSPQFQENLRINPAEGSFVAVTALDKIERINAYHRVGDWPFIVLVGFETRSYFAPWRTQAILIGGLGALTMTLVAMATAYVYQAWRRETEHSHELARESGKRRALLLAASDGIHVLNHQGHLLDCSESFVAMLGASREHLIGRHVSTWDAKVSPDAITTWLGSVRLGTNYQFETLHRREDGTVMNVEVHCVGVRIDGEDLIYCAARDISERKLLEAQLSAASAEVQDLYDNAPCGYHSLDSQGRFLHINATELAWIGCNRDEVVGKLQVTDFFTQEGREQFRRNFPMLMAVGRVEGLEFDLVSRHGETRRVSMSATAVKDADGQFLRSRSVFFDITELKRARDQVEHLTATQQAMLNNELIGIATLRDRKIVWKNQAMNRIFGYHNDELIGLPMRALHVDEETYLAEGASAYPVLEAGGRYRQQLQMVRRDGNPIWVDANGVMLSPQTGETLWMLADITSIKNAQAKVEHLAFHDGLTGLPNRLLFADRLDQALARAQRHDGALAVCYLDLDGFKQVNDLHGHGAGDDLLRVVARRIQGNLRAGDTVSRLGGDEFVMLITRYSTTGDCLAVLRRIAAEVGKPADITNGAVVSVSASIGVAMYPQHGAIPEELMSRADSAMYDAKRAGKNQVRMSETLD